MPSIHVGRYQNVQFCINRLTLIFNVAVFKYSFRKFRETILHYDHHSMTFNYCVPSYLKIHNQGFIIMKLVMVMVYCVYKHHHDSYGMVPLLLRPGLSDLAM